MHNPVEWVHLRELFAFYPPVGLKQIIIWGYKYELES